MRVWGEVAEEYKRISWWGEGEHSDAFVEVLCSRLFPGGRCCFGGGGKIGACSGVCEDWLAEGVRSCRNLPKNPYDTSGWTLGF